MFSDEDVLVEGHQNYTFD